MPLPRLEARTGRPIDAKEGGGYLLVGIDQVVVGDRGGIFRLFRREGGWLEWGSVRWFYPGSCIS